jgi:hypothetical protein
MKPGQITTSVALFYHRESDDDVIPFAWFKRALEVFDEHHLSPIMFTAGGGPFELDDCYRLADGGSKEFRWGDPSPIYSRRSALVDALQKGTVYYLDLDTPRADGQCRSEWHANVSASSVGDDIYIGIDEDLISDPVALIRRAWEMARGLFDIRYGFAYKMQLADDPASYATGSRSLSLSELKEWIRRRHEGNEPPPTADELWKDELSKRRRHLTGLFRGVYHANVLSALHVDAADLRSSPVGKLSEIDDSLWLWELSEDEMPIAETVLRAKRLLISQPSDA